MLFLSALSLFRCWGKQAPRRFYEVSKRSFDVTLSSMPPHWLLLYFHYEISGLKNRIKDILSHLGGRDPTLRQKYIGPLPIFKDREGAYRLELPPWWKIHNIFHVTCWSCWSLFYQITKMPIATSSTTLAPTGQQHTESVDTGNMRKIHIGCLLNWEGCSASEAPRKEQPTWKCVAYEYLPNNDNAVDVANSGRGELPRDSPFICPGFLGKSRYAHCRAPLYWIRREMSRASPKHLFGPPSTN